MRRAGSESASSSPAGRPALIAPASAARWRAAASACASASARWRAAAMTSRARATRRRSSRYALLKDIDPLLKARPLELSVVEKRLASLSVVEPIEERVTACILGVPEQESSSRSRWEDA